MFAKKFNQVAPATSIRWNGYTLTCKRRIFADADGVALATVQACSNAAIVGERARVIAASAGAIAQPKEIRHDSAFQAPRS